MKKFIAFFPVIFLATILCNAQTLNNNWTSDLETDLREFTSCDDDMDCSEFSGKALQTVYKLNDFYQPKEKRYMRVSEIIAFLQESTSWTKLGPAYQQSILNQAQEYANNKKAVIAVLPGANGVGHVALILPGELQASGSWGLSVPNSASFLTIDPAKSYVGKGLSYAFTKNHLKDVVIFARNY
ncbi:MAG: hypothetical protein DIU61_001215 [Bacteroidota bacterium]|jgi:hypothetical protein|nr:MAG: hypothetical protein DIU61_03945 [Bacteroidota bacterium]